MGTIRREDSRKEIYGKPSETSRSVSSSNIGFSVGGWICRWRRMLLYRIRSFMKCGVVRRNHGDRFCWRVRDIKNLSEVILPFFEKHPLKSQKNIEFHKFAKVIRLMEKGGHLTPEGFQRVLDISSEMNRKIPRNVRIKIESTPQ